MRKNYLFLTLVFIVLMAACKKWDDHIALIAPGGDETLMEQISSNPELSVLKTLVEKVKLDTLLSSSKSLTLFAPTNDALESLDNSIIGDDVRLKQFVLNLIAGKAYFTKDEQDTLRIQMYSGKRVYFNKDGFGGASVSEGDIIAKNGVLHVINKAIVPLPSIWEYIADSASNYAQNKYIKDLVFEGQDPNLAEIDSIDMQTGLPVYVPGTGVVQMNSFKQKVYDLSDEDSLFTYVLLEDNVFDAEVNIMKPFFTANTEDTTMANAKWSVVKDLAIKGANDFTGSSLNMLSKFNAHINLDKAAVVEKKVLSNGFLYIVKSLNVPLSERVPVVYVQGENPYGFSDMGDNRMEKIFFRQRYSPITSDTFQDIYANFGSSSSKFYIDYTTNGLYTTTYKVYWVALNDLVTSGQGDGNYGTDQPISQILQIRGMMPPNDTLFTETGVVEPNTYTETYIGEFVNDSYNWLLSYPDYAPDGRSFLINPATKNIRLQTPPSSSSPYNLTLDYLKFVPVFN